MLILLLFVRFVLGIDFGSKSALVVLTTIVGSLTGASFGAFISALVKKGENLKVAIIITVSTAGSFLRHDVCQDEVHRPEHRADPGLSEPVNLTH